MSQGVDIEMWEYRNARVSTFSPRYSIHNIPQGPRHPGRGRNAASAENVVTPIKSVSRKDVLGYTKDDVSRRAVCFTCSPTITSDLKGKWTTRIVLIGHGNCRHAHKRKTRAKKRNIDSTQVNGVKLYRATQKKRKRSLIW